MLDSHQKKVYKKLGIPIDYGFERGLPFFHDEDELVNVELNLFGKPQKLSKLTSINWESLVVSAKKQGISLLMVSGYRSFNYQAQLIQNKLDKGINIKDILKVNAPPGFSEHHGGMAIDIATIGVPPLIEAFDSSPAFLWLEENAIDFKFSMPYTKCNSFGFIYEPWHWSCNE